MFNSIAPVKRAASSALHAVVADHSFMVASCCGSVCVCICAHSDVVPCRLVIAWVPQFQGRGISRDPKVRFGLSISRPDQTSRPTSSARSAAAGGRVVAIVYGVSVAWQEVWLAG